MNERRTARRLRITGHVQGVWFRRWTQTEATRLGLSGWVRNDDDGAVSALISGPEAAVSKMLDLLWQGPPAARVDDVASEAAEPDAAGGAFRITG